MMKKSVGLFLGVALLCGVSSAANAQTTTASANMSINASISSSCSLSLGQPAALTGAPGSVLTVQATIGVTCTNGTTFSMLIGEGINSSQGVRRLKHTNAAVLTNNLIPYTLSATQGSDSTLSLPTVGTGALINTTVWIRASVPAAATVGSYSDTVVVSITY